MAAPQLVITVNGPGEISAWLYPLAEAVKALRPDIRIRVCLLPCVFSSGAETHVLDGFDTVDSAADVAAGFGLILKNRLPAGFERDAPTLVFHLGGEEILALLIARRLGTPAYGYFEATPRRARRFARQFFSGLTAVPPGAEVVGDMMVDAARLRRAGASAGGGGGPVIGVFPGSRGYMVRHILPFLAAAVDRLAAQRPGLRFVLAQAPYVSDALLRDFPPPLETRDWEAQSVRLSDEDGRRAMVTEAGTRMEILSNAEVLARADYAVSLPGTNTGEMAAAGIPTVVVLPEHMAARAIREVPLPGLAGHLGRLPLIGAALKRIAARNVARGMPVMALPNRRAGRAIVPELRGAVSAAEIAEALGGLLDADRAALSAELVAAMGAPGAAARLAREISDYFDGAAARPAA